MRKKKLAYNEYSALRGKVWDKKMWLVYSPNYHYQCTTKVWFANRDAAILWLKRYGEQFRVYRLCRAENGNQVTIINGFVYFCGPNHAMNSAESKQTASFATRNN